MNKSEQIDFVISQVTLRGMTAGEIVSESGSTIVRIKCPAGKRVCGSVTIVSSDNSNSLVDKVLSALRAAIQEPVLKGAA